MVLVGGGLGVAPVYPQLRAFKEAGNRVTGIIGFRNKDLVFWEDKFRAVLRRPDRLHRRRQLRQARASSPQALKEVCEKDKPDLVVAIGPLPMMNACVETTRPFGVKTMVSLNAIMVDGTGMCGSCRVTVGKEVQVRLRRRPGLRRPPGRLQGAAGPAEALQGPGDRGHRGLRARLQPREAALRGGEAQLQEDQGPRARTRPRCRSATHVERARNFKEVNLGYSLAGRPRRGRALHPVREADLHRRLPGGRSTSRASSATCWCATSTARSTVIHEAIHLPVDLRPRLPAGDAVRGPVHHRQEGRVGRHRPARALRRRQRPARSRWSRRPSPPATSSARWRSCGSGPAGLAVAADLVQVRLRRHGLRGAPRGRRRAPLRHPVLPPAARHHRPRGEAARRPGREDRDQQGHRQDLHRAAAAGREGLRRGLPRRRRRRPGLPRHPRRVRRAGLLGQRVPHPRQPDGRRPVPATRTRRSPSARAWWSSAPATPPWTACASPSGSAPPTVRCVYRRTEAEAPARIEELRHAKEEGIEFFFLHAPVEIYVDEDGNVKGMKVEKMELGEPDEKGPPQAGRHRRVQGPRVRHRHLRARHQGQPDHHPVDARAWPSTSGATSSPTTARPRAPRCRASSPAATSSPAAPRSSWPWAPGAARPAPSAPT